MPQIPLAQMVLRAGKTRRSEFVAAAITPTGAQRDALLRIYMRVVRAWGAECLERIMPAYERQLATMGVRDAVEDVEGATESAGAALARLVVTLEPFLEDWAVRVEEWHRGRFGQLFTPVGVKLDTMLGRGDVRRTLESVLADNTSLIRSLNDQMRNGISGAVFRGLTARSPARDVAKEIRKVTGIGARRAELIASDQLQKLAGALDQERQEQVGLDEFEWAHSRKQHPRQEHVARNGQRFKWNSPVGRNDPPGRAIRCGCRARAVLPLDEAQTVAAPPPPPPPAPPPPPPPPPAPAPTAGFRSPVNPGVNDNTIRVEGRLAVQKRLRGEFSEAAKDARYGGVQDNWGGRTAADRGNATFSAGFDDHAVSMVGAIKPELDDLAAQIGVPPLRGFKSIAGSKHVANQGDGVMALNPTYFNAYAAQVGGREVGGLAADLQAQRAALQAEMAPIVERIKEIRAAPGYTRWNSATSDEESALFKRLDKLRERDNALWKKQNVATGAANGGVKKRTDWKPGDDVKGRPFSIGSYFESGTDQARATLYHEFGHHVHQYLKREGPRRQFGPPPLERDLRTYFRQALHARPTTQASRYSMTNEHEWFAENFALFALGRTDLVDTTARELIERIFRGDY